MIPIHLELQAFGPYMEKETIDFTQFLEDRLFLITGNTGSGKTMIFDAICYALFGEASGQDRKVDTFKSHFSDKSLLTYVQFKFLHREKEYLILREPEQIKISKGKEVTHRQLCKLLFDDEVIVGVKNVNQKIIDILGINYSQFKQIVMIAQGEFRKLVSADSRERETIYRKIFNTMNFENIQNSLKEKASSFGKKVDSLKDKINGLLDSIKHIKLISYDDLAYEEIIEILSKEIETYNTQIEKISKSKDELRNELNKQEDLNKKLGELLDFQNKFNKIDIPKFQEEANILKNVEKTFSIRDKENLLNNSLNEYNNLLQELNKLDKLVIICEEKLKHIEKQLENQEEIKLKIEKLKDEYFQLKNLRGDLDIKINLSVKINNYNETLKKFHEEKIDYENKVSNFKEQKVKILEFQEENKDVSNKIISLKEKISELNLFKESMETYKECFVNYKNDLNEYEGIKPSYNEIFKKYSLKVSELNEIEEFYLRNQAGILARNLVEGEPCMVCGSKSHPNKASLMNELVNEETLKKAKEEVKALEIEKNSVNQKAVSLKNSLELRKEALEKAYESLTLRDSNLNMLAFENFKIDENIFQEIEKAFKTLDLDLKSNTSIEMKILKEKNELTKIDEKINLIDKKIIEGNLEIEKIKVNLNNDKELLKDKEENLKKYNIETLDQYNTYLKNVSEECENYQKNLEKLHSDFKKANEDLLKSKVQQEVKYSNKNNLENEINKQKEVFLKLLDEKGFSDVNEYNKYKLTSEEYERRNEILVRERENFLFLKKSITNLKENNPILEKINKDELKYNLENILQKINGVEEEEKILHSKISLIETVNKNISSIVNEISTGDKYRTNLNELSSFANGSNKYKISFERYILGIYFEEIIHAANIRFSKLTNGRYLFKHLKDNFDMRSQQGLDMSVFDNYTSKERKINTLSGGESFKASLSLALGLSDVVQRYSGGISIDTLFIDEGFGSLDSDSLQNALECLLDANDKSKLIGIISHVQELKDFIKSKIEVINSTNGSKIKS